MWPSSIVIPNLAENPLLLAERCVRKWVSKLVAEEVSQVGGVDITTQSSI